MKTFDKILIVNSDPVGIILYRMLLEEIGFAKEILTAQNGKEGLEIIKQYFLSENKAENDSLGLVFLTINLPYLDAFEILEELNKLELTSLIEAKIVVFTTSANVSHRQYFYKYGVKQFIDLPPTEEKLLPFLITE